MPERRSAESSARETRHRLRRPGCRHAKNARHHDAPHAVAGHFNSFFTHDKRSAAVAGRCYREQAALSRPMRMASPGRPPFTQRRTFYVLLLLKLLMLLLEPLREGYCSLLIVRLAINYS
jgi:hypothetical protein